MSGQIKAADLARDHGGKQTSSGWLFRCPCSNHGRDGVDTHPSLIAWDADDGLALTCKAGCSRADVLKAFGLSEQDIRPPKKDGASKERKAFRDGWLTSKGYTRTATYPYTTIDGTLLCQVLRYEHPTEHKAFFERSPDGSGGWFADAGDRKVPYRWPELAQAVHATAFICEGEKDTDRLISLGFAATTVASGSWSKEAIEALKGFDCLILEDNDAPGRLKAKKAAASLYGVAASVRIVRIPGLGEGEDVSNWLDHGGDPATLVDLAKSFPVYEQADAKADAPRDAEDGDEDEEDL